MDAVAEGHVRVLRAADVEVFGIVERLGIAVAEFMKAKTRWPSRMVRPPISRSAAATRAKAPEGPS